MCQICASFPSKDKLVIKSLIALCNCLIAGPNSLSITVRLNSFQLGIYQYSLVLVPVYQILPRHVKTVIGNRASWDYIPRFTFRFL